MPHEDKTIIERLEDIWANDDHERGCEGRTYSCTCGYDQRTAATAEDAAAHIRELEKHDVRKLVAMGVEDGTGQLFVYGTWEAINAACKLATRAHDTKLETENARLRSALEEIAGGCTGRVDHDHLASRIARSVLATAMEAKE